MKTIDRALFDASDDVRERVAAAATRPVAQLRRRRKRRTGAAAAVTVLLIGFPLSLILLRPASTGLPAGAVRISEADLPTEDLIAVAELRTGDELYFLPAREHSVFVRVRPGEATLMFGTSCDVVSDTPLPVAWEGLCLEYTSNGQRISGRFAHGTRSDGSDTEAANDSPDGPIDIPDGPLSSSLQDAVRQIPELATMTQGQALDQRESGSQWGIFSLVASDGSRVEIITQVVPEDFNPQHIGFTIHEIGPTGEDIFLRETSSALQVIVIDHDRTMLNLIVDRLNLSDPASRSALSHIQPDQAKEWALLILDIIND